MMGIVSAVKEFVDRFANEILKFEHPVSQVNALTQEEASRLVGVWSEHKKPCMIIPTLYRSKPDLHERYMRIHVAGFFYFSGLAPLMTNDEYDQEKRVVYSEVYKWSLDMKRLCQPGIPDEMAEHIFRRGMLNTVINFNSEVIPTPLSVDVCRLYEVTEEEVSSLESMTYRQIMKTHLPHLHISPVLTLEHSHMQQEYTHLLINRYLSIVGQEDDEFRGPQGYKRLFDRISYNHDEICAWARTKYYSGERGINDYVYDSMKQKTSLRTIAPFKI